MSFTLFQIQNALYNKKPTEKAKPKPNKNKSFHYIHSKVLSRTQFYFSLSYFRKIKLMSSAFQISFYKY